MGAIRDYETRLDPDTPTPQPRVLHHSPTRTDRPHVEGRAEGAPGGGQPQVGQRHLLHSKAVAVDARVTTARSPPEQDVPAVVCCAVRVLVVGRLNEMGERAGA